MRMTPPPGERVELPDCRPLHLRVAELCTVFLRKAFVFQTVLDMGEDLGEEAATARRTRT
jgi:hypothetical protein